MPDIACWNKCNNKCVMCTNDASFALQNSALYSLRFQIKKMEKHLRGFGRIYLKNSDKKDFISLTGGEPTLHPDFFRVLAYFRKRLPAAQITLLSNGRAFAKKAFAGKFILSAAPPFLLAVPIHASGARLHDKIAGVKGAFKETINGLSNLKPLFCREGSRQGVSLEIRIVLHKLNIANFTRLAAFILKTFPASWSYRLTIMHYEIEGASLENAKNLELKLSKSAAILNTAYNQLKLFPEIRLYHFPLCVLRKELRKVCYITMPSEDRTYPKICGKCKEKKRCPGLMKEYFHYYGESELKPL